MDCLNIKLTDTTENNSLRRLDEFGIDLVAGGDGSGTIQFSFFITSNTIRLANGNGGFYSDAAATNYLGTELTPHPGSVVFLKLNAGTKDTVFYKRLAHLAKLRIEYPSSTNQTNAPQLNWDISSMNYLPKLTEIDCSAGLANTKSFIGYIENLSNPALVTAKLSYANTQGNLGRMKMPALNSISLVSSYVYGDINNLLINNPQLKSVIYSCSATSGVSTQGTTLDIKNIAGIETYDDRTAKNIVFYTGGRTLKFDGIKMLSVGAQSLLATAELDDLLIALAASNIEPGCIIKLSGTRTMVSDSAMSTLASKGATVTITIA